MNILVPVLVDGIGSDVDLAFTLTFETELASELTPYTTLRDYLAANPDSSTFDAFPLFQTVEVTFLRNGENLEALAIRQVDTSDPAAMQIDGLVSTDILSRGMLVGDIQGANWSDDVVTWTVSLPVTVHGIRTSVLIPVRSETDTPVTANDSDIPMDIHHPGGHVQVEFRRSGNTLEATRFTELR